MSAAAQAVRNPHVAGRDGKIRYMTSTHPTLPTDRARRLDLEADAELQYGHIARDEHLARQAAALRGWDA